MRLSWSILFLAFAATAMAKGLPLCVSAGVGSTDSGADESLIFVAGAALMSPDIKPGVVRTQLTIGLWHLVEMYPVSPGVSDVEKSAGHSYYGTVNRNACYQAAVLSWRGERPPNRWPHFELGAGLGVHEEWQSRATPKFVPRAHLSARWSFFPSQAATSFLEFEVMPRLGKAGNSDIGLLFWAKLGYSFRV